MISDFLIKLKILDDDKTVSLTACSLWVVLIKLALMPSVSMTELGSLLVAMLAYQGKKLIKGKMSQDRDSALEKLSIDSSLLTAGLQELQGKVSALTISGAIRKL